MRKTDVRAGMRRSRGGSMSFPVKPRSLSDGLKTPISTLSVVGADKKSILKRVDMAVEIVYGVTDDEGNTTVRPRILINQYGIVDDIRRTVEDILRRKLSNRGPIIIEDVEIKVI